MNALDRIIAAISPEAGLARARSRLALDYVDSAKREYDAATRGRRAQGWRTRPTSANGETGIASGLLRDRARDMVRNNPYAKRAKSVWAANAVGTGIIPRIDEKKMDLFRRWSDVCDADERYNFFGLQSLICKTEFESGEVLVRFRTRRVSDGLPVPLQLQVLEPDHIDTAKNQELRGGNYVIQGVEFSPLGKRVAYWMFPTHPGDSLPFSKRSFTSVRVPAKEILHIYDADRAAQVRGVTALAASLMGLRDFTDYGDAELVRKKVEACFAAFVTQPEGPEGIGGKPLTGAKAQADGQLVESLEPGIIKYLPPGNEVTFGSPQHLSGFGDYHRTKSQEIAAGMRVTHQQMTGDLTGANYSSMRAGRLEFTAILEEYQANVMIHQFCRPAWLRLSELAVLTGVMDEVVRPEWTAPKPKSADPLKDAQADLMRVRTGSATLRDIAAENGRDPATLLKDWAAVAAEIDALNLVLDSDPRKVAKSGATQSTKPLEDDNG